MLEKQIKKKNQTAAFSEPIFFLVLVLIGIAFVYVWLAKSGNGLEKYTDIVCEYTSIWNSNKSGENASLCFSCSGFMCNSRILFY